ncbi:MAG TPA: dihydrolipoyl dehydrogenase [Opitutales bacterium]|nr:dihydrolipoyl dehydrogenase [Opitutales bacterium]
MPDPTYDLVVIGSGPGGYVAAIRAAQLGLRTALVEKDASLGGTCLNVGCIPSKALLHSTELLHELAAHGAEHGIKAGKISVDIPALMKRKTEVVGKLTGGVRQLMKLRNITVVQGLGKLGAGGKSVEVTAADGAKQTLETKNILIATGSVAVELPFMKFDGKLVVSSDQGIAFDEVPKKLVVIGAGAIGLELGSVWARLGSEVTVVELLPRVAATYDEDISRVAQRVLQKQGIKFELGAKVTGLNKDKTALTAQRESQTLELPADKILVAVGRKPTTAGLGAAEAGLKLDQAGRVVTDAHFHTNLPNVFAIGDVIAGPMLAHKAEEEGVACAELIAGKAGHVNYNAIPAIIYTEPEIASVGLGETEAKAKGIAVKVGKFNMAANGRALAANSPDGFVKIIADPKTDRVLGAQIIAHNASEMIAAITPHLEYGGSAEDIARTVTAHPTLAEAIKEAALAVDGRPIHAV